MARSGELVFQKSRDYRFFWFLFRHGVERVRETLKRVADEHHVKAKLIEGINYPSYFTVLLRLMYALEQQAPCIYI